MNTEEIPRSRNQENIMIEPGSEHLFAIVMAGGTGSALWPVSRRKVPRHFLPLFGRDAMIAATIRRLECLVRKENILVMTSHQGALRMEDVLGNIDIPTVIVEPQGRNTAPCIALATAVIRKRDPDAVSIIVPADHQVLDENAFRACIADAIGFAAEKQQLVAIGVRPRRPETSYGYLQVELPAAEQRASDGSPGHFFRVRTFAEKPDGTTARKFLESGDFYWNSGIYIWHIDAISREFRRSMPDLYRDMAVMYQAIGTAAEHDMIEDVYSWQHPVSIVCGVMEQSDAVVMIEGRFGWRDLGSWDDLIEAIESEGGTARTPDVSSGLLEISSERNTVHKAAEKAVCLVGVNDLMVIDTDDALLVCRKGSSQGVRKAVDIMRREGLEKWL